MYRTTIEFHERVTRGEVPIVYVLVNTAMGWRGWATKELQNFFGGDIYIADGTYDADGTITAGGGSSLGILEGSGRLLNISGLDRSINPKKWDLLTGFTKKQQQRPSITLDNNNHHITKLIAQEPILNRAMSIYLGFESMAQSTHLKLFKGTVFEVLVRKGGNASTVRISANESG